MSDASVSAQKGQLSRIMPLIMRWLMPICLVLMGLGFAAVEPRILSEANLLNITTQASYLVIFAAAQMVVILTRGFDLSLGMCVSSVSVLVALVMTGIVKSDPESLTLAIVLSVSAGIAFGVLVGAFNGFCVSVLRVNPFIVTLGSLNICYGIASTISGGRPVFGVPREFSNMVYSGEFLGIPAPIIIAAVLLVIIHLILTRTVFGRGFYILGSNPRAAKVAGMPSRLYLTYAYIICSVLAAIGAILLTARTGSGEPNLGGSIALESIAAAVIGGVSLRGGVGGIPAVLLGAVFVTVLSNGMNLTRIDGNVQMIVLGCVVIAAVFVDRIRTK
ncbi:ABC transporter permease [Sneathiella sp. HT1-7]|uniref:ABC transporter permease n=1 Tax=Sneathiella sp. HT1-7 TaxID=2887192 RepID=UPI001D1427E1|nr:ABC transporter permease [Sneathiella sp. HT1-7]MCC3305145.1 ABC transporter permease [Sneathiella sp. HT1-7]